jgi:hypothetical protein
VILTDSRRSPDAALDAAGRCGKLAAFAARRSPGDRRRRPRRPRQRSLGAAAANAACPFATNLVAEEIKGIVDSPGPESRPKYVVIAGNDAAIPFFAIRTRACSGGIRLRAAGEERLASGRACAPITC